MHKLQGCSLGLITCLKRSLTLGGLSCEEEWSEGKGWVLGKERTGSQLSTQSHQRQGYRPDTVFNPRPQRSHKSPDRQTQQSNSTLTPFLRLSRFPLPVCMAQRSAAGRTSNIRFFFFFGIYTHVDLKTTRSSWENRLSYFSLKLSFSFLLCKSIYQDNLMLRRTVDIY